MRIQGQEEGANLLVFQKMEMIKSMFSVRKLG